MLNVLFEILYLIYMGIYEVSYLISFIVEMRMLKFKEVNLFFIIKIKSGRVRLFFVYID